jgi:hypothetical protein
MNGARMKNWAATITCARRSEKSRDAEKRQVITALATPSMALSGPKAISAIEAAISPRYERHRSLDGERDEAEPREQPRQRAVRRQSSLRESAGPRGWPLPLGRLPHRARDEPRAGADALARDGKDAVGAGQDLPQPRD